jgi:hypothetical protein
MKSHLRFVRVLLGLFVIATFDGGTVRAQFPVPQLNGIFPCGARQGTEVEATITGGDLNGATGLYFSHAGIQATKVADNKFKITVPANVPVGRYDVRVVCPLGVSSARSFVVGDLVEALEQEPNNLVNQAQRIELPTTLNGQINGSLDIDQFTFTAKKGQRVIVDCWAWRIDSRLDATLMLFDAEGKELAYSGDFTGRDPLLDFTIPADGDYTVKLWDFIYAGGADYVYRLQIGELPYLDAVVPSAVKPGESNTLTLYGRNLPGSRPAPPDVAIQGRPLDMLTQTLDVPNNQAEILSIRAGEAVRPPQALVDGREYRLHTDRGMSNPLFVGYASEPIVVEQEPNNTRETAQRVPVPCEVSGTFAPAGDLDYYVFSAKKNDRVVVEILGERQSKLVDPMLTGFDAQGKRMTATDDGNRNIGQLRFTTTSRDGRWELTAPADGDYVVQVRDLYHQQRGDVRFTYRLTINAPRPDFRLVAVPTHDVQPDATVIRRGGRYWLDVLAHRNDGFNEPITISAENLPPGVSCLPVVIGPDKTSVPLVFDATADAPLGHAEIRIVGRAKINDAEVVRQARAGGLVWSTVNTPGIARLADTIVVSVREPGAFVATSKAARTEVVAGEKVTLETSIVRAKDWDNDVVLTGFDLPNNAVFPTTTIKKGATSATAELTVPANLKLGTYSFILHASGQVPRNYPIETDPAKRGNNIRVVLPTNALTITVVAPPAKK